MQRHGILDFLANLLTNSDGREDCVELSSGQEAQAAAGCNFAALEEIQGDVLLPFVDVSEEALNSGLGEAGQISVYGRSQAG